MAVHRRFVATTYNLWGVHRWPERADALRSYCELAAPDILCLQEFSEPAQQVTDAALPRHERVQDGFEGWRDQGNIYWSTDLFEKVEYGAVEVGQQNPLRRLFWVRLRPNGSEGSVLVATVHLTYQGNERERLEGISPRLNEARQVIAAVDELTDDREPVLIMGDLNDSVNVIRLFQEAGYTDSFKACGAPLQPTHPTVPTGGDFLAPLVLDWQFARGPIRAMNSHVGEYFDQDLAPSDHKPVVATYGLEI